MKTNWKRMISVILAVMLVAACLPAAALADGGLWEGPVSAEMVSHFGENGLFDDATYTDSAYYSDSWFLADSAETNYSLALVSAMTGGASYSSPSDNNGKKISALMAQMGFTDVQMNDNYAQGIKTEDSIGCIIGRKTITDSAGKTYTLLAAFPRNAGYEYEWVGNFNVGESGYHAGFALARDQMLEFMGQYIGAHNITGAVKIWSAGYSRGAATANLLGGYLAEHGDCFEGVTIAPEDLFVYTIGTPMTIAGVLFDPAAAPYLGIHNFAAYGDYITKLPPASWGFTRYGVTEQIEYGDAEMRAWLEPLSETTAKSFENGGYTIPRAVKTLDINTLSLIDTGITVSPDAMIAERLNALMGLAGSREALVNAGYQSLLGDLTVIFGADWEGFYQGVSEADTGTLVKAAVLNYLAYAVERQGVDYDEDGVAEVLMQLMEFAGKPIASHENYTGQRFLADLLDFVLNDYQTEESAQTRAATLSQKLPVQYAFVYLYLLVYAQSQQLQPHTVDELTDMLAGLALGDEEVRTLIGQNIPAKYQPLYADYMDYAVSPDVELPHSFDDLLSLTTHFIEEKKDSASVSQLLDEIVAGIPEETASMIRQFAPGITGKYYDETTELREILLDVIHVCNYGAGDLGAKDIRALLIQLLFSFGLKCPYIGTLVADPSTEVSMADLAEDIVKLLIGDAGSVTKAADASLAGLLKLGRTEKIGTYVDALAEKPADVRRIAATLLFQPGESYVLTADVRNAATFIDMISFLFPAHDHELYISWLKTKVTCRVVFESNGGSAVADVTGLARGAVVPKPADPTRAGDTFGGWYKDAALTQPWNFKTDTVQSICTVLYARWNEIYYPDMPAPAATVVTVPVSGEDATVNVKVEVKGDAATIKEADIDKVLEAEEVGTVSIDLSGLENNINEVVIPGAMVDKIADAVAAAENDADGLEIRLPAGSVTFDAEAVAAIAEQTEGGDLTLNLDNVKVTELTSAQQEAVGDLEVEVVLDAYLTSGGERITDFKGGSATVKVPYTLKDGQTARGLVVWYVSDDGKTRTQVPAAYDGENIVFTVPHFSNYVIAYDAEKAAECPKDDTCPMAAFSDLDPTAWYHDGVHFCLENGMMNGVGDGLFDPSGATSRAMIVTILYRLEGEPAIRSGMPFTDVTESDWYAIAISWAESLGFVNGYEDGTFRPNDPITREQLAAILYRYAQYKGEGFIGAWMFLLDYPDAAEISDWADEAMHWCVMQGIINGKDGKLVPGGNASRAEAATMVHRFCELIK